MAARPDFATDLRAMRKRHYLGTNLAQRAATLNDLQRHLAMLRLVPKIRREVRACGHDPQLVPAALRVPASLLAFSALFLFSLHGSQVLS